VTGLAQRPQRVAADLVHACEKVGFFYALNHGVPDDTIEQAFAASRRFHALPLEQKLALRLDDNNIGYLPIDASIQGASAVHKAIRPNQNESFFVTHDRGPDHPDTIAGKPLRGRNQWPPGLPGLRADMMAYFDALRAMCDRMLPPLAMALASPIVPGTFLINLGNIMRRWSNDRFLSTPHGVINESGSDRYSIAYFHSPNPDAVIECAPTCTGVDNPPRYRRLFTETLFSNSTGRISFTRRVTASRRRRAPSGRSHNAKSTRACPCSISNALSSCSTAARADRSHK
jgi:isopenicillin N synthase-like dioxygenase